MIKRLTYPLRAFLAVVALLATLPVAAQTVTYIPIYTSPQRPPIYIPQYRYNNPTPTKPWRGHSLVSFHVGTGFLGTPSFGTLSCSDFSSRHPLTASVRYAGEKYFANRFFWGWQSELTYNRMGLDYILDGPSVEVHQSQSLWNLALDARIAFGYDISYFFSLNLSVGVYCTLLSRGTSETWYTDKTTGIVTPVEKQNLRHGLFDFNFGLSAQLELLYYITDNIFASCAARVNSAFGNTAFGNTPFESMQNINRYALLLGIGYKSYNHRHQEDE